MSDHYETKCPSCGGSDEQGCYADCPTHHITALEARVRELEEALTDLLSWFPDKSSEPMWQLKAGVYGADEAVSFARAALNQEKQK